jgi:hypothetical protein
MKVSRSLKWTRTASIRTRKLARDMLLFWKRIDKEMVIFNLLLQFIDFYGACYLLWRTVYFKLEEHGGCKLFLKPYLYL